MTKASKPKGSKKGGGSSWRSVARPRLLLNSMKDYRDALGTLTPWTGEVPQGFLVDFLGILTDVGFRSGSGLDRSSVGGGLVTTSLPSIGDGSNGEGWFEAANWMAAAQEAREHFIMISLGAHYGAQLVGGYHMLRTINPLPCTLVGVEAEPGNFEWISDHMRDNGIDADAHWLLPMAISDCHEPVLFPVGSPGYGSNNCFATNASESRRILADLIIRDSDANVALRNLIVENTTGFMQPVHPDIPSMTEVKVVSAITLEDLLSPFDRVDYLEADIQQSEILVFPPFMSLLRRKVRRVHIGTHGKDLHASMHRLFVENNWDIVFSFEPNAQHECELGTFELNDGILTAVNPSL